MKLPSKDLNPVLCSPHPAIIYICGVTTAWWCYLILLPLCSLYDGNFLRYGVIIMLFILSLKFWGDIIVS